MLLVADAHARHLARPGPARDRLGRARCSRSSTASRAIVSPPDAPAAARRARARRAARRRSATRARRGPALRDVDLDVAGRARRSRSSAPPARARRRWCSCSRASTTSTARRGADRRRRRARRRPRVAARARSPSSTTTRSCSARRVAENIAYARADATREEIERAAAPRAGRTTSSRELPDGYDTRVGERGLTLSGGQRQRIAIARALLADPRILILDDATSSVDASTEQEIKAALREVMAGRTTFVIAHRLSTIALADEIVVLEDGAVAAHGDHDELLEQSALYARDRREGAARPGVPHPQAASSARWRACDDGTRRPAPRRAATTSPAPARHERARAQAARAGRAAAPLPRRASC